MNNGLKTFIKVLAVLLVLAAVIAGVLFAAVPAVQKKSYPRKYSEYVEKYSSESPPMMK